MQHGPSFSNTVSQQSIIRKKFWKSYAESFFGVESILLLIFDASHRMVVLGSEIEFDGFCLRRLDLLGT